MRKTKIVCTIGPASGSEPILTEMIQAGMNVARINMSHGNGSAQIGYINNIKSVRKQLDLPVALMIDTKGPEVRIGTFHNPDGAVEIKNNTKFTITTAECEGDENRVSCNYNHLHKDVKPGNRILLNDGLIELKVDEVVGKEIRTTVVYGGILKNRKGMFLPGVKLSFPFLSDADKEDLKFACEVKAQYIAASFVNCAKDILDMRKFLDENGGKNIHIISKIESIEGVKNIDEILEVSNGVMVARGDLGVEISLEKVPSVQKLIIQKALALGIPVITATEMLESMTEKTRPTRAEVTDVANAVYERSTAIMLSGETAIGKHPVLVVQTMAKIAEAAEQDINYDSIFAQTQFKVNTISDAICHSTCRAAANLHASVIVVWTHEGKTPRRIARFRQKSPILAVVVDEDMYHKLALEWAVIPHLGHEHTSADTQFSKSIQIAKAHKLVQKDDMIVTVTGIPVGKEGSTNLLKIDKIV